MVLSFTLFLPAQGAGNELEEAGAEPSAEDGGDEGSSAKEGTKTVADGQVTEEPNVVRLGLMKSGRHSLLFSY